MLCYQEHNEVQRANSEHIAYNNFSLEQSLV